MTRCSLWKVTCCHDNVVFCKVNRGRSERSWKPATEYQKGKKLLQQGRAKQAAANPRGACSEHHGGEREDVQLNPALSFAFWSNREGWGFGAKSSTAGKNQFRGEDEEGIADSTGRCWALMHQRYKEGGEVAPAAPARFPTQEQAEPPLFIVYVLVYAAPQTRTVYVKAGPTGSLCPWKQGSIAMPSRPGTWQQVPQDRACPAVKSPRSPGP